MGRTKTKNIKKIFKPKKKKRQIHNVFEGKKLKWKSLIKLKKGKIKGQRKKMKIKKNKKIKGVPITRNKINLYGHLPT